MALPYASAGVLTRGDIVKLEWASDTYGHGLGGGEFAMFKLIGQNALNQDIWQRLAVPAFCVEYNEHVWLGTKMVVGGVSDRAVLGGRSGQVLNGLGNNLGDPISNQTRFLYESYATGALSSTGFLYGNNVWADSLQEALWRLEGEVTSFSTLYGQQLYNYANSFNGAGSASVFVVNLFALGAPVTHFDPLDISTWGGLAGHHRQDQLLYDPVPPPPGSGPGYPPTVPEPLSLSLWLVGIVAMGIRGHRWPRRIRLPS